VKEKKKKTIFIVLLLVVAIGGAGAYVGGKFMLRHRIARWREEGIAASVAGDHEKAASLLAGYLQRGPAGTDKYIEALRYYIISREQAELPNGQHFAETLAALKLLVGDQPDSLEDRRHLLRLYVKLERRPEALDTANAILSNRAHPEWAKDLETLEIKSEVLTRLLQFREALNVAHDWTQAAPLDVKAQMARLSLRSRVGQPADAIVADAQALRAAHPGDPRFEFLVGYAYSLSDADADSRGQAVSWLKTAATRPDLSDDLTQLIVAQFDNIGMPDESMDLLQKLVKRGAAPEIRHTLARRCWELGRWDPAVSLLADLNPSDPKADPTLLAMKAMSLANLGKADEAAACRSALAARTQAAPQAWTLLLRRILDNATLDDKDVVAKCRAALSVDLQNPYLAYYLGDAEFRLLEFDLAGEAWRVSAALDPTWGVPATRLVEVLLRQGRPEQARWLAFDAYRHSHTAGPAIAMARAYAASMSAGGAGQTDELFKLTGEIQNKLPGEEATLLIRIQLQCERKEKPEAVKTARDALGRTPVPPEPFFLTLATLSRRFALGIEDECFSRCEQAHGLTAALAYGRAIDHLLSADPNPAAGLRQFDELAARAGKSQSVEWRLARARYSDLIRDPGAKAAWVALGDAFPDDLSVQRAVSSAKAVQGDWVVMEQTIDRLRSLAGEKSLAWRLAKARLMVGSARNDGDNEQGAVLLNDIIKEQPALSEPRVLLALALVKMNRVDGAIEQLSQAVKLEPYSVPLALQLASLLQSRGDFERVQHELDRVIPQLHSPAQRHQAAMLLTQQGNSEQATQLLEHAQTQPSGGEGSEDLLLAVLYRKQREFDKCEAVVKKLLGHPNLATIQFAASLYASQGRRADAEAVLSRLDSLKLAPAIKELTWGNYCAEAADLPGATRHFETATAQAPTNPAAWRLLATAQAAAGKVDAAMATVDRGLGALPANAALKAVKAHSDVLLQAGGSDELRPIVLFVLRDPLNGETAIELLGMLVEASKTNDMELLASRLQQLTERHPDFLPAQIQYADCLAAMDRHEEALAVAQHALTAFPDSPEPARLAVRLCAAAGRWSEMEAAANAWRTRSQEDAMAADVALAQAQMGLRHYESAMAELRPYLAGAGADPHRYADLITTYSISAVKSDQAQVAADLLWPLAEKSPDWRVRWIVVAVSRADTTEALRWLDRVAAVIPADGFDQRVALAEAFALLGERGKDAQITGRSAELFARICADPKATAPAVLAAAGAAERRGEVASAESLYRRALGLDPNLWVAQNNLAVLVARHGGDVKEAAAHAAAAAQLEPRKATIRDTLAEVQSKAGDVKAAADAEQMAIKLEPLNPKWRVRLAQYLLDAGDLVASQKAIQALDDRRLDFRELATGERTALTEQLKAIRKRLRGVISSSEDKS